MPTLVDLIEEKSQNTAERCYQIGRNRSAKSVSFRTKVRKTIERQYS